MYIGIIDFVKKKKNVLLFSPKSIHPSRDGG